ncbi:hypothetical protein KP509_1Z245800 [Ceratopteris richardii]|nr:hypothetical protein KP509_1Z245800 [Ceratopteris richardii]
MYLLAKCNRAKNNGKGLFAMLRASYRNASVPAGMANYRGGTGVVGGGGGVGGVVGGCGGVGGVVGVVGGCGGCGRCGWSGGRVRGELGGVAGGCGRGNEGGIGGGGCGRLPGGGKGSMREGYGVHGRDAGAGEDGGGEERELRWLRGWWVGRGGSSRRAGSGDSRGIGGDGYLQGLT